MVGMCQICIYIYTYTYTYTYTYIYIYTMFTYIHWNGPPMMLAENGGEQFMDYICIWFYDDIIPKNTGLYMKTYESQLGSSSHFYRRDHLRFGLRNGREKTDLTNLSRWLEHKHAETTGSDCWSKPGRSLISTWACGGSLTKTFAEDLIVVLRVSDSQWLKIN